MRVNDRPRRVYEPWDPEEDDQLREAFEAGSTAQELADLHQRSLGAIKSRLLHLGLVVPRAKRTAHPS
jgi:hypothetical protein